MVKFFLNAKHWHLFLLLFVLPACFQVIMFAPLMKNLGGDTGLINMPGVWMFPILMLIYCGLYFGWFWSVAIGLQNRIPAEVTMKVRKFKLFFFIPLLYIPAIFLSMVFPSILATLIDFPVGAMAFILPFHLLSMFGMFYLHYFTAKTIKTAELHREAKFGDFVGEFFLIWFFIVGIWILQPRINELAAKQDSLLSEI